MSDVHYRHTHESVRDGSPAMQVGDAGEDLIILINEDGHVWTDPVVQWRPISTDTCQVIVDLKPPTPCGAAIESLVAIDPFGEGITDVAVCAEHREKSEAGLLATFVGLTDPGIRPFGSPAEAALRE
jgi:hypothetical protein